MFSSAGQIQQLFGSFESLKIMIVGDVMIDTYLKGIVDRISPEAPVPVVALRQKEDLLGGAANVALNIKALGAEPLLYSIIGDDNQGKELIELLDKEGISSSGIIKSHDRITTTKYRIIGNKVQMLRVDHETVEDLSQSEEVQLLDIIRSGLKQLKPSVVILQDYNKGVLTEAVIGGIIHEANLSGIPVVVDPKRENFFTYQSVSLFKPNLKEIREGLKIEVDPRSEVSLDRAADKLHELLKAETIMITLSDEGVYVSQQIHNSRNSCILKAHVRNIADVSGAGDTVISVAALCIATEQSLDRLACLSNLAGGLVCEYVGVVPVKKSELLSEAIKLLVDPS
ncbi:MAG: D-glycero-beta-D-manno-heptose-7-phosphate kinase [Bacteroidetes bacterium]|nr:D-glycero-beta-D-manno-heptose-7-phosphate kinase [Bacteroidota bacterium]